MRASVLPNRASQRLVIALLAVVVVGLFIGLSPAVSSASSTGTQSSTAAVTELNCDDEGVEQVANVIAEHPASGQLSNNQACSIARVVVGVNTAGNDGSITAVSPNVEDTYPGAFIVNENPTTHRVSDNGDLIEFTAAEFDNGRVVDATPATRGEQFTFVTSTLPTSESNAFTVTASGDDKEWTAEVWRSASDTVTVKTTTRAGGTVVDETTDTGTASEVVTLDFASPEVDYNKRGDFAEGLDSDYTVSFSNAGNTIGKYAILARGDDPEASTGALRVDDSTPFYDEALTVTIQNDDSLYSETVRVEPPRESALASGQVPVNYVPTAQIGNINANTGTRVGVNGAGSDDPDGSVQTYVWRFNNVETGDTTVRRTSSQTDQFTLGDGEYEVELRVIDNDGAVSGWSSQRTFELNANPTAKISTSPSTPRDGDTISFDGTSSYDTDGRINDYKWYVDGRLASTNPTFDRQFSEGTYNIRLVVEDDDRSRDKDSVSIDVLPPANTNPDGGDGGGPDDGPTNTEPEDPGAEDPGEDGEPEPPAEENKPPKASLTVSKTTGNPGDSFTFDASGSDDLDGTIEHYNYTLVGEDGVVNEGSSWEKKILTEGSYKAVVFVTDNDGATSKANVSVKVNADGDGPPDDGDDGGDGSDGGDGGDGLDGRPYIYLTGDDKVTTDAETADGWEYSATLCATASCSNPLDTDYVESNYIHWLVDGNFVTPSGQSFSTDDISNLANDAGSAGDTVTVTAQYNADGQTFSRTKTLTLCVDESDTIEGGTVRCSSDGTPANSLDTDISLIKNGQGGSVTIGDQIQVRATVGGVSITEEDGISVYGQLSNTEGWESSKLQWTDPGQYDASDLTSNVRFTDSSLVGQTVTFKANIGARDANGRFIEGSNTQDTVSVTIEGCPSGAPFNEETEECPNNPSGSVGAPVTEEPDPDPGPETERDSDLKEIGGDSGESETATTPDNGNGGGSSGGGTGGAPDDDELRTAI